RRPPEPPPPRPRLETCLTTLEYVFRHPDAKELLCIRVPSPFAAGSACSPRAWPPPSPSARPPPPPPAPLPPPRPVPRPRTPSAPPRSPPPPGRDLRPA